MHIAEHSSCTVPYHPPRWRARRLGCCWAGIAGRIAGRIAGPAVVGGRQVSTWLQRRRAPDSPQPGTERDRERSVPFVDFAAAGPELGNICLAGSLVPGPSRHAPSSRRPCHIVRATCGQAAKRGGYGAADRLWAVIKGRRGAGIREAPDVIRHSALDLCLTPGPDVKLPPDGSHGEVPGAPG